MFYLINFLHFCKYILNFMPNKLKPGKQKSGKVVDCSKCMTGASPKESFTSNYGARLTTL